MTRQLVIFPLIILLLSCSTSRKTFRKDIVPFSLPLNGTYSNKAIEIDFINNGKRDSVAKHHKLTKLFDRFSDGSSDSVYLSIGTNCQIELKYVVDSIPKTKVLYGKLKKQGYCECFLYKKVIQIPPFIAFIYSRREIDRLRIGITHSGLLIMEEKYVSEGNILIYGAGVSYKVVYYFKDIAIH